MLVIENLKKCYGKKIIFQNLNARLENGIYFIIGPNGSGKSTLFRCISNADKKYEGKISFRGKDMKYHKIGYLPQNFGALHNLTVQEIFQYVSLLKKGFSDDKEIEEIIAELNLTDYKNTKTQNLSGGTERRVGIGLSLIDHPDILILDEPSVGLDPKERIGMLEILAALNYDGIMLVSTHILDDIEKIPGAKILMLMSDKLIKLKGTNKNELEEEYLYLSKT